MIFRYIILRFANCFYFFFNLGFHQVLLQIMLTPATVVNGLGSSLEEAVDNACYNALSLIKLLCSR